MEIPFSSRSRFFEPIGAALKQFPTGHPVKVMLGPGGYERDVHVHIRVDNPDAFQTDWKGKQPSRFSARIRAAATVLRDRGLFGRYRITHFGGTLTVTAL
jgi:hypothetical protein